MSKKMPENYDAAIVAAKGNHKNKEKLNKLKPISKKIVKAWDKLSDTEKKIISSVMKNVAELVEELREIV